MNTGKNIITRPWQQENWLGRLKMPLRAQMVIPKIGSFFNLLNSMTEE